MDYSVTSIGESGLLGLDQESILQIGTLSIDIDPRGEFITADMKRVLIAAKIVSKLVWHIGGRRWSGAFVLSGRLVFLQLPRERDLFGFSDHCLSSILSRIPDVQRWLVAREALVTHGSKSSAEVTQDTIDHADSVIADAALAPTASSDSLHKALDRWIRQTARVAPIDIELCYAGQEPANIRIPTRTRIVDRPQGETPNQPSLSDPRAYLSGGCIEAWLAQLASGQTALIPRHLAPDGFSPGDSIDVPKNAQALRTWIRLPEQSDQDISR